MEVIRHDPEPAPPPTYDIIGLTEDQAHVLHALLGSTLSYQVDAGIFHGLSKVLKAPLPRYTVLASVEASTKETTVMFLKLKERTQN